MKNSTPPIVFETYGCPSCWREMLRMPDKLKGTLTCICQNCRVEYHLVLNTEKGVFEKAQPENVSFKEEGKLLYTDPPAGAAKK